MLNKDLVDKKDIEIAKLKLAIEKFKRYDAERKQYYSDALKRLGELESYVEELEAGTVIPKLKEKVTEQRKQLGYLNNVITVNQYQLFNNDYILTSVITAKELRERNKVLGKEIKNLRKTVKDLIYRLNAANQD